MIFCCCCCCCCCRCHCRRHHRRCCHCHRVTAQFSPRPGKDQGGSLILNLPASTSQVPRLSVDLSMPGFCMALSNRFYSSQLRLLMVLSPVVCVHSVPCYFQAFEQVHKRFLNSVFKAMIFLQASPELCESDFCS